MQKVLKNKKRVFNIVFIFILFLILSLFIPLIGISPSSTAIWIKTVIFFESSRDHFKEYWFFYAFIWTVIAAFFFKK